MCEAGRRLLMIRHKENINYEEIVYSICLHSYGKNKVISSLKYNNVNMRSLRTSCIGKVGI